ncbi:T9SS type A sorting domain-containing protein [Hymenobacter properus]|uniref:T9SS type A sorting domain-containing protein n=1 Tax=Hymenobacter properus TaxID=2791026 RepID=A0A931BLP2_9BACT|nr:T9SS type A sorting domain-containing protein [Hymenobacter properus]MBF9141745.1 T9SS type A sorting domain-containing protein [Hymenobacter properus]MBR7720554.1 T9SS type A sorting domain-containing protein [Microvirga sp. SRT04]
MKNTLLKLSFFFLLAFQLKAQNSPFVFQSLSQQPYADLAAPVQSLNNGALWDRNSSFAVPLGFTFTYRNQAITSINVLARGVQFVGLGNLYMFVYNTPFGGNLIQDRGIANNTASMSPVSYAVSGAAGNRIGKIEWKNAGVIQSSPTPQDPTHFVSCQLWLYEQGGKIEIHFGPSFTTATSFQNNSIFVKTYSDNNLAVTPTGNSNNPSYVVENCNIPCYGSVTGAPAQGTVYVFNPNTSFATAARQSAATAFSVYPQPARQQLTIDLKGAPAAATEGQLIDAQGRVVHSFQISQQQAAAPVTIALPTLATGLYALALRSATANWQTQRLVIEQ